VDESTHTPGKRCTKCLKVKPVTEFTWHHKRSRRKPSRRPTCRECSSAYMREYTRPRREFLQNHKMERGCTDCGYREHPEALQFDHLPGTVKLFEPSNMRTKGTWQQMLDEVAKCEVVCANCHAIRTATRKDSGKNAYRDLREPAEVPSTTVMESDPNQLTLDWSA